MKSKHKRRLSQERRDKEQYTGMSSKGAMSGGSHSSIDNTTNPKHSTDAEFVNSIKLDIIPNACERDIARLFTKVAEKCGLQFMYSIERGAIQVARGLLSESAKSDDYQPDFWVTQELIVRDYGASSTKYVSVVLSWLDINKKLSSLGTLQKLAFRKNIHTSKKAHIKLVEELKMHWLASYFQQGLALEVAEPETAPDAFYWQELDPSDVDYNSDSSVEDEDDAFVPDVVFTKSKMLEELKLRKAKPSKRLNRASSMALPRPKSVLKLTSDAPAKEKKKRSVRFSSEDENQVEELKITRAHREARMGVGCTAVNKYGQIRPLTSLRTGNLAFLASQLEEDISEEGIKAREQAIREKERRMQRLRRRHSEPSFNVPQEASCETFFTAESNDHSKSKSYKYKPKQSKPYKEDTSSTMPALTA